MNQAENAERKVSKDGKLTILFIIPSLVRAGAERQLVDLVNGLPCDSYRKHLLCYGTDTSLSNCVNKDTVTLYIESKRHKVDLRLAKRVANVIDTHNIDIVHCTLQNALLYGSLGCAFARKKEVKLIGAIHTTINVDWRFEIADQLVFQHLLRRCASIWFVCESQERHWLGKFRGLEATSHVVYNGVDSNHFRPMQEPARIAPFVEEHSLPRNIPILSCIAGFRPEKGHALLLDAFKILLGKGNVAHLVLAGDGEMRKTMEEYASSLDIQEHVSFIGTIDDVQPLLAISTCTVLASTAVETFSIAMLESMSMGVPVISSNIGGAAEAIEDGENGYLVEPGDIEGLAASFIKLVADENHAMALGREARKKVLRMFDVNVMVQRADALLSNVAESL